MFNNTNRIRDSSSIIDEFSFCGTNEKPLRGGAISRYYTETNSLDIILIH